MIFVRDLELDALCRCVEIDVTEDGDLVLGQRGTEISSRAEEWHRPARDAAHWAEFEARWRGFIPDGGIAVGAFDDATLIGVATLCRGIRPGVAQLEALFVDRGHRRRGVAASLCARIEALARAGGAAWLYVSATPSESAVGFYLDRGFTPTADPIPELLALEPDDVHMLMAL